MQHTKFDKYIYNLCNPTFLVIHLNIIFSKMLSPNSGFGSVIKSIRHKSQHQAWLSNSGILKVYKRKSYFITKTWYDYWPTCIKLPTLTPRRHTLISRMESPINRFGDETLSVRLLSTMFWCVVYKIPSFTNLAPALTFWNSQSSQGFLSRYCFTKWQHKETFRNVYGL